MSKIPDFDNLPPSACDEKGRPYISKVDLLRYCRLYDRLKAKIDTYANLPDEEKDSEVIRQWGVLTMEHGICACYEEIANPELRNF